MRFMNLNDNVSVILTKDGADRLNEINASLMKVAPTIKFHLHCEGETYKTQLWCLFDDFGDMINMSSTKLPFKDNEIKVL